MIPSNSYKQDSSHPLFITGTDTGVGKTVLTAAICCALQRQGKQVGVFKPVETGVNPQQKERSDGGRLGQLVSSTALRDPIDLYCYPLPLAPLACARQTGLAIDPEKILQRLNNISQKRDITLIEGAGGLLTPLTPSFAILDLILLLQVPCLVVGQTDLGAVNHTLLTLRTLQQTGIPVPAVVMNEPSSAKNLPMAALQRTSSLELIQEFAKVPVIGPLGYEETIESDWQKGIRQLANHAEIQRLIRLLE